MKRQKVSRCNHFSSAKLGVAYYWFSHSLVAAPFVAARKVHAVTTFQAPNWASLSIDFLTRWSLLLRRFVKALLTSRSPTFLFSFPDANDGRSIARPHKRAAHCPFLLSFSSKQQTAFRATRSPGSRAASPKRFVYGEERFNNNFSNFSGSPKPSGKGAKKAVKSTKAGDKKCRKSRSESQTVCLFGSKI